MLRGPASPAPPADTLARLRRALLATYVLGAVGTVAELLLLEHFEDPWQWTPIALLTASLLVLAWHAVRPRAASVRAFQGAMLLCVASGAVGALLHYDGNLEFEREMDPSLAGVALVWQAVRGATPALAPGTMVLLGVVGLAWAFRHPALGDLRDA